MDEVYFDILANSCELRVCCCYEEMVFMYVSEAALLGLLLDV